ncbi:uncharacterized protein G2W53_004111 [Senna tora]|uniref:Uncharacterized protein n=1 Tax=Senna tora TaxID=362788 RepID=A0A834XEK7_9FABA|nr:uncharacterized protein G2W53_004111 [Senna tora]
MRSPPSIPQPSSSASTSQPQEPVEELSTRSLLIRLSNKGQLIRLSNRGPYGMLWIQPCGQIFHPSVQPVRVIIKLITSKFEEPHHVYSQVLEKIKKLWFQEWAKNFKWLPKYEHRIKDCWNFKADE